MPRGIRKGTVFIPGQSSWKRTWSSCHYKSKGLSLEDMKRIMEQPCYYCGSPPTPHNAYGNTFVPTSHKGTTYEWWLSQWILRNGIDKINPQKDYSDISN